MKKSISFHKTGASRLLSLLLTVCLMVSLFAMPTYAADPQPTAAKTGFVSQGLSTTGTTYFVDAGNGDDANTGKSADAAWKSLDKVSATTFKPGDHILLRAGSTWNGQMLYPKGSGSNGEPIIIDIYDVDSEGKAIFTANARPIINGNGTKGIGSKETIVSGAVMTYNQEYIEIYNLEVTNSEDLTDTDAYLKPGKTQRAGILAYSDNQTKLYEHIIIKDCYVHDVQSEFFEKANDKSVGGLKAVGGIIVLGHFLTPDGADVCPDSTHRSKAAYKDVLIEGNTVKRVGLEGIRTKAQGHSNNNTFYKVFENVTIRNNYLEDIAGDGIVLTEVKTNGLVENNIAKQPCNADYGTKNYAGIWSMFADDTIFQHNENYGIVYGYNDGEAYDIDMSCDNNIYQYNYSHHNNGGFLLFMGDQSNSVVRYNISANDGGGSAGTCSSYPSFGFNPYTYKEQSIFHYWNKADNANMPTIYNNTFYIGDGVSTSLYGEGNSSNNEGTISRFYNNIIYKDGAGTFKFLANQPSNGTDPTERKLAANPEKFIKNNLIWPESIASVTSGTTVAGLEASGNIFAQPMLKLDENKAANLNALAAQKNTAMDFSKDNVYDYTSTAALRARADMFKISDTSPAIAKGMQVAGAPKEDFFGNTITNKVPDIGAHQISNVISSTEATSVAKVNVTTLAGIYPVLPSKVTVTFTDTLGTQTSTHDEERSVVWDNIKAEDINKSGTFNVNGTVAGISIKASATVTVNGDLGTGNFTQNFPASADAYMERGKKNDTALGNVQGSYSVLTDPKEIVKSPLKTSFTNNYVVKIKNATAPDYNRRFVTSFDVSAFTGEKANIKNASIKLHISRYDVFNNNIDSTARFLDVYAIPSANTWDETTVTWNNMTYNTEVNKNHPSKDWANNKASETVEPTYGEVVPVAHKEYINRDIIANDNTIEIDVTEYIRTLDPNVTTVSFLVDSPYSANVGHNVDNGGFDAFSKEGAKAAYDAFTTNKLPEGITVASETSLAPQLMISDVYPTGIVPIEVDTKLGVAPVLPTTATVNYSDGSTKTVSVMWDTIDPAQYGAEGEFTVSGRSSAVSVPMSAKVTVTALKLISFDPLADIYMPTGLPRNELGLATSATALLNDGSRVSVN
ncbi:MAG: Ig-like domain-containing protein, partial [Oscillospiraceae bacterium]